MPIAEQLRLRALRLLNDGRRHSEAAYQWALEQTGRARHADPELTREGWRKGFTARELSLGAGEVVSL